MLSLMQDYLWLLTDYHGQNSPAPNMPTKSAAPDAKDRGVHTPVDTEPAEEGDEASADEGNADDIENTDNADVVADAEEADE